MNEDSRKDLRIVEKGSNDYVSKIKYVKEQLGVVLREAKDLVDFGVALTAGEIVKRYKDWEATGLAPILTQFTTIGWVVWSTKYPKFQNYYHELPEELATLIRNHPEDFTVTECLGKKEVMAKLDVALRLMPASEEKVPEVEITLKTFSLWVSGYQATGEAAGATYIGQIQGVDFNDAVKKYVEQVSPTEKAYWAFQERHRHGTPGYWTMWGCRAYDNETSARRAFG